ncbi:MAG: hypothetical protein EBY92_08275, partial [Actinobacteria bacterium]|nr:hypothetical protein [Actinomycetota bacterium]
MSSSAEHASSADIAQITALLGRRPQGDFTVILRRDDGAARVVRNAPLLHDGTTMPTRYWLVDPHDAGGSVVSSQNHGEVALRATTQQCGD